MKFFLLFPFVFFFIINSISYKNLAENIEVDLVNLSNVEALSANASKATAVPIAPIINLESAANNSGRSVSPNLSNLSHLSQPVKKESNLRSWFHLPNAFNAGGLTGRSTPAPVDVKSTSIYSAEIPNVTNDDTHDDTNSPPQSTKTSSKSSVKTNFGDSFYNKQNKLKEQKSAGSPAPSTSSTPSSNVVVVAPNTNANSNVNVIQTNRTEQQQQTKSSRRTTSLLNLFMSNSQGNRSHLTFFKKKYLPFLFLHLSLFYFKKNSSWN